MNLFTKDGRPLIKREKRRVFGKAEKLREKREVSAKDERFHEKRKVLRETRGFTRNVRFYGKREVSLLIKWPAIN